MAAFVVGAAYAYTWVTPATACLLGIAMAIIFNALEDVSYCTFSSSVLIILYIDEVIFFDILYTSAYSLLAAYFYGAEYRTRYGFYQTHEQEESHRSYRDLLNKLPVGLILFHQNDGPIFYNDVVKGIIQERESSSSGNTNNPRKVFCLYMNIVQKLSEVLEHFKEKEGPKTLKDVVNEWSEGEIKENNEKFTYKNSQEESTYTIKGLKTIFRSKKCKALVMQDQTAYERLAKLEEKYQKIYVASVVHDIRTPLNGIVGMLDMLDIGPLDKDQKIYLSVAKKTCTLLLYLTYDITDYSQLEAKRFKANNSKVNIREVLDEIYQLLSFSFERKKLGHFFICEESVPQYVKIDRNRYIQILLNLLGNALKFTFEGFVKVIVLYDPSNDHLITTVQDTGIGIKEEDVPKLFKLFGKLESSSSHNVQGVGLGLSICKRLSESLGGFITVDSKEGVGSTFTFAIKANLEDLEEKEEEPIVLRRASSISLEMDTSQRIRVDEIPKKIQEHELYTQWVRAGPTQPTDRENCTCSKILIVDDNEYNLFVLQSYLKAIEVSADEALNGQEAIDKILKQSSKACCKGYKVAVLDINMPVLDGIETAKILKHKMKNKEIPPLFLIALSAQPLKAEEQEFFFDEAGFSDYITKPTKKADFLELVKGYGIEQKESFNPFIT
eukprot:TRINITY_DN135000_c0_g1_i1.p1 TRINITY_DN135000_c0_g1~~TRINITY_DN135000_c0_g1_i1.p1  ORF type:complete len:668 (-),score=90.14 TRINITY_DN135000_c0_g1_i1:95-2098(-)